jgi:hypothetical protein
MEFKNKNLENSLIQGEIFELVNYRLQDKMNFNKFKHKKKHKKSIFSLFYYPLLIKEGNKVKQIYMKKKDYRDYQSDNFYYCRFKEYNNSEHSIKVKKKKNLFVDTYEYVEYILASN